MAKKEKQTHLKWIERYALYKYSYALYISQNNILYDEENKIISSYEVGETQKKN